MTLYSAPIVQRSPVNDHYPCISKEFVIKKGDAEAKAFQKARQAAVKALGKLTGGDKEEEENEEEK